MNSAISKNGFSGFASKLRDQAKDVVGKYKLPTLDDMAKNDEYIHSPEFNVRGNDYSKDRALRQDEVTKMDNSVVTNGSTTDEASYYSKESSRSLLDLPSSTGPGLVRGGKTTPVTKSTARTERKRNDGEGHGNCLQQNSSKNHYDGVIDASNISGRTAEQSNEVHLRPSKILDSKRQDGKKPSVSLLSVLPDVLQPTIPVLASAAAATTKKDYNDDKRSNGIKVKQHYGQRDDDSDQSSGDFYEDNPIFPITRNKNNSSSDSDNIKNNVKISGNFLSSDDTPTFVTKIKKSSNRFMEDLRLKAPIQEDDDVHAIIRISETETGANDGSNIGPFDGYFKSAVIQNFNRIILRRGQNDQNNNDEGAAQQPPPLARQRLPKPNLEQRDTFGITVSTSVGLLGDEDLEQLKELKLAGETSSTLSSLSIIPKKIRVLKEYFIEHRRLLFVAFTLLLSIVVYFRRA